jgi:hypothetical protein
MSDTNTIKVPTWALPIAAAALSGAIAWGSMQARAEATDAEVQRIEQAVKKTAERQ